MSHELNLDNYLAALRKGGSHLKGATPEIDAQFTILGQAVAAFMDLCRATEGIGYAYGRQVMEETTHMFPTPPSHDNGAVREIGGGMAVVNLLTATDAQLRDIAERSGIPFDRLKAAQAEKRAEAAKTPEVPAPKPYKPADGTDWAAMEAQFNTKEDKGTE